MSRFIHLHAHSHYSFLEALPKVEELVEAAKKNGMEAVGLTDSGNMHGAIEFYKAAVAEGVKPIIGVDAYVAAGSRFDKEHSEAGKRTRLVLLAENNQGYKNLLSMVTKSHTEGFFEKPRVDKELLREYHEGVIALIPSFAGEVPLMLAAGDTKGAAASLAEYVSIFGTGNVFLEITHHPKVAGHTEKMKKLVALSTESDVPLVAQHDVYYLKPSDQNACEVLRRIQHSGAKGRNEDEDFSFITEKEALKLFKETVDAVDRTKEIADRCNLSFELGNWIFPEFPTDPGKTHAEMLRDKTYAGLSMRGMKLEPEIEKRIEYELSVINGKGYEKYFLVVSDLLTFAKKEGILTTTRGSAAGSLVSYLTGITNVDPIFYKLPFERFLNPERPKAPDIDMDFADDRRGEMIAYAKRKYGEDRVAQIGTFGTMMARAAVRDVCRALGHSYGIGDRIAKLIPIGSQGFPMTIERAMQIEKDLKTLYDEDDDVHEILDLAKRIEGCVRHVGVHAAGVVIAPTPLTDWAPLQFDPKGGGIITQFDMYSITDEYGGVGLLKFDFLGIKNLAILGDAVERVRESRDRWIDIENIPIDDAATFGMLARGETEGVFQLNGSGMTRYLKELRPTSIFDINAMVALYRPGPMESIPSYIERKRNPALVRYLHPKLESILDQSYGVVTYQDDVLLIAVHIAGYSWKDADALRKAMGKKIPKEMKAQKEKLLEGFREHGGLTPQKAEELWSLIEPFAAYGFGKAHAASYGKVAYQTAYMKANYPVDYMAAVLTADAGDTESIATFVAECERMMIPVLPPDVNESGADFTVAGEHKDTIRFGLTTIKNFGEGISEAIIAERNAHGSFVSLSDFLCRVGSRNLNKKALESLIKCGALDSLAGDFSRASLLANIEILLAFHRDATTEHPQDSLFGAALQPVLILPTTQHPVSLSDKLEWERDLLGIYVSGHPLDAHAAMLEKAHTTVAEILANPKAGQSLILPVLIAEVRPVLTKGGDRMAFVRFEDKTASIEAVLFPKLFKEHAALVTVGTCVLIKGAVSLRNGEVSFTVENMKVLGL